MGLSVSSRSLKPLPCRDFVISLAQADNFDLGVNDMQLLLEADSFTTLPDPYDRLRSKRDARAPDAPTIWELMEKEKTPEASRRLATIVLAAGVFGRPMVGAPGVPAERVKVLRDSL